MLTLQHMNSLPYGQGAIEEEMIYKQNIAGSTIHWKSKFYNLKGII